MEDKDYKVNSEHLKLGEFCLRQSVTQVPKIPDDYGQSLGHFSHEIIQMW